MIAPGSDADIVVFDPAAEGRITAEDQSQNVDYTPYEGIQTRGAVERVYLRGVLAAEDGRMFRTTGRFVHRKLV